LPLVGYDTGRYWEEKYQILLDLILEMKKGKLTVLTRRFQQRARVSYRKAEEYVMVAIDNGHITVTSDDKPILDADEASSELKAGRTVHFQISSATAPNEKTEIRFDVETGRHIQMPLEEDENVTEYMQEKAKLEKLRKAIDSRIGGEKDWLT
jgi:hypothetical protein